VIRSITGASTTTASNTVSSGKEQTKPCGLYRGHQIKLLAKRDFSQATLQGLTHSVWLLNQAGPSVFRNSSAQPTPEKLSLTATLRSFVFISWLISTRRKSRLQFSVVKGSSSSSAVVSINAANNIATPLPIHQRVAKPVFPCEPYMELQSGGWKSSKFEQLETSRYAFRPGAPHSRFVSLAEPKLKSPVAKAR